jgi:hypothetical protein
VVVFGFGGMVSGLVVVFGNVLGGVEGGAGLGGLQGVAMAGLQGCVGLGGLQGCGAFGGLQSCVAVGVLSLALGRLGFSSLGSSTFVLGRAFCLLKAAAALCVGLISAFTPPPLSTGTPPAHT